MSDAISVTNLSIQYGDEEILVDLTFTIPAGAITMIIGPNGSGKTTLLKALLGLLTPDRGNISVLGQSPAAIREKIGYVPQRFEFDRTFPLTVLEFLHFSAPKLSAKSITTELARFDMAEEIDQPLGTLSGGQLQRVLITRSLLHQPAILYLDEPVSGVDVEGGQTFYELINTINKERGITVIMVSHELDVVQSIAQHVICLNRSLVCAGGPSEALTPETIKQLYGKDTALYHHHH